jgi:hypothetical protein
LTVAEIKKTAAQKQSPKKKPDADGDSRLRGLQASGFRYGLYEIPGINV